MMNIAFLFSFGFLATILEIHLLTFEINHLFIALLFVLQSGVYFLTCLAASHVLKNIDERTCMTVGATCMSIGYLMLGPWRLLFPKEIWITVIALTIMGIGQGLTYSKIYLVFSVPYMLKSASNDYGFANDDILTDVISSFCVIGCSIGEILGPLYSGFVSDWLGIEASCTLISFITFGFTIIFAVVSEVIPTWFSKKKKSNSLIHSETSNHKSVIKVIR